MLAGGCTVVPVFLRRISNRAEDLLSDVVVDLVCVVAGAWTVAGCAGVTVAGTGVLCPVVLLRVTTREAVGVEAGVRDAVAALPPVTMRCRLSVRRPVFETTVRGSAGSVTLPRAVCVSRTDTVSLKILRESSRGTPTRRGFVSVKQWDGTNE